MERKNKEKIIISCAGCGEKIKVTSEELDEWGLCEDCRPELHTYECIECGRNFETDVLLDSDEAICSSCSGGDYFVDWERTHRGTPGYEGGEKIEDDEDYPYSEDEDDEDQD